MTKPALALVAIALVFAAALSLAAVEPQTLPAPQTPPSPLLATDVDRVSYAIGVTQTRSLRKQGLDIAPAAFLRGVSDGLNNATPLMTEQQMGDALQQATILVEARMNRLKAEAGETLKRGQAFLAENAKKEGVVTLPSGLQYKVIAPGEGLSPAQNDSVVVNYRGTLIDGTEFDSTYGRGPGRFRVGGVIEGWQEGLKLMKKGAKWQLFVPANLAYKESGNLPVIGPNEALIFEVELLDVQKLPGNVQLR